MMRGKAISTTKWGTACAQCSTAKAKCSGRSATPGSKCDRYMRALVEAMHRPGPQTAESPTSGSNNAENPAFDSLASTPENPSSPSLPGDIAETVCSASSAHSHMGSYEGAPFSQAPLPESYFFSSRPGCLNNTPGQFSSLFDGRDDMDERLLTKYRTQLMPLHPFVIVPDHVPATVFKTHRPFLMLAIRVVAGFESLQSMHGQMQLILDYLSDRMFRQAERSLDLLMGIVVVLGWYHYHCMKHSQLNNLLCLAESLVSDLGLNRRPVGQTEERTIDERRLLLGVWYLRSSAAMYLQQLTSMPFTSYMRQCLVDVQQEKEHELDDVLVYYLKVQYLTERVAVLMSPQVEQEQPTTERSAAMASSQEYFDKIIRDMPEALKNNGVQSLGPSLPESNQQANTFTAMITTHLNTVVLRLCEPQPSSLPLTNLHVSSPDLRRSRSPSAASHIETSLGNSNAPVRSWFESWVKGIPLSLYRSLPSNLVFQLLYAVGSLARNDQDGSSAQEAAFRGRSVSPSSTEAIHILDRLVALSLTTPDMTHFWAALGERYDEVCAPSIDNFSDYGDEAPSAPMGWMQGGSSQSPPRGLGPATQQLYHGNLFIPPSRVGSVGPAGQDDYQVGHTSVPMLPVSGSMTHLHPTQWVAVGAEAQAWDANPAAAAPWQPSAAAPQIMVPEDLDPQLWLPTTAQGGSNTPYAEGPYYMG
ncbi:hypothetical protein QBC43DRAFT_351916 [Cladorrhinum sp. PSN259]|nr:hypothetical protein QBC43DRAFT_351916 [Cladorrhinum sp. PSN259]